MNDAELLAKSALLFAGAVEAMGDNDLRRLKGETPCYMEGTICWQLQKDIEAELRRRGVHSRKVELAEMLDKLAPRKVEAQRYHAGDSCKDESDGVKA